MLIDSHAHLSDSKLVGDSENIIAQLAISNIGAIVEIGYDIATSQSAAEMSERHDNVYAAVGVHPSENYPITAAHINELTSLLNRGKVVAIGEIGLDYHYDNDKTIQRANFDKMIDFAAKSGLPVILHVRDAFGDMESIYYDMLASKINANILFHCFAGSAETVRTILKKLPNAYFAFGGAVTFKNYSKQDAMRAVPEDRILLETDCPYMTPEPHRGKLNTPLNIVHIADKVAAIMGWSSDKAECITSDNTRRFFNI